ncbi:hypothetical protein V5O48_004206 [Marasmius crinis-equi]|uniref:Uncharacterized protein n=1 Tax=Marasmius crinis-equi TaxID=585013 RepID=A0ABR3FQQ2_9AGAR
MAHFFTNSSHTRILGDHPVFQNISGDATTTNNITVINKSQHPSRSSTSLVEDEGLMLMHIPREINPGDIILRKEVSSQVCDLAIATHNSKPTNPFRERIRAMRVRKKVYTAEIIRQNVGDIKFTVVAIEPEDPNDRKRIGALVDAVLLS